MPPRPPHLVVMCNEITPFRIHWHRRIRRELPGLRFHTLCFPHRTTPPWTFGDLPDIGLVRFIAKRPPGAGNIEVFHSNTPVRKLLHGPSISLYIRTFLAEWREARNLLNWLDAHRPDAVIINGYYGVPHFRTLLWCWRTGTPSFLFSDSNIKGDKARGLRFLLKKACIAPLLATLKGILPCGKCGIEFFDRYNTRRRPYYLMPLEPDYAQIENLTPAFLEQTREKFKLDAARRRIIVACRFIPLKRVETAIDAFARLAAQRPEWDLLLVGDGPCRGEWEARVPPHLTSRVRFAGFVGDQQVVSALYKLCDVMLLPSEQEAWAMVVQEAACAGLALVCSDVVGAAYELLEPGVNGRMFPPGDVPALADALREVTDAANLPRMKAASPEILARWRHENDPMKGLRAALRSAGLEDQAALAVSE